MSRITCISIALVLVLGLPLVGCVPKGTAATSPAASSSALNQNYENALPVLSQLMVGTFRLEKTEQAVTAAQAAELLPLWKAYRSLSGSDSASSVELEAVVTQIEETMTQEQLAAIASMRLTNQDLGTVMQEQGMEMTGRGGMGNLSPEQIATRQAQRAAGQGGGRGGGPGGGPGGGGFFGGPGGGPGGFPTPNAKQVETLRAQRGGGGGFVVQGPLFDALIKLLQEKAG